MSLRFLLDTNVVSEPIRKRPNPRVLRKLSREHARLATAAVVWHELVFGAQRLPASEKRTTIETYLSEVVGATLPILPYDAAAAAWHGAERARLSGLGQTPSFADGQIAAIAVVNGLTLVTDNVADFARFDELDVERWHR